MGSSFDEKRIISALGEGVILQAFETVQRL